MIFFMALMLRLQCLIAVNNQGFQGEQKHGHFKNQTLGNQIWR